MEDFEMLRVLGKGTFGKVSDAFSVEQARTLIIPPHTPHTLITPITH